MTHRDRTAAPDALRIRQGRPEDLPAILAIEAEAFEPARRSARSVLVRALTSHFQRVLVLEAPQDDAPSAGTVVAGYLVAWPFRRTWRIYNLASSPRWRNRGVGGALVAAAIAAARCAGARRVVLESRREPGLLGFYEHRGFRVVRVLPDYYAAGEDAVRMELRLR